MEWKLEVAVVRASRPLQTNTPCTKVGPWGCGKVCVLYSSPLLLLKIGGQRPIFSVLVYERKEKKGKSMKFLGPRPENSQTSFHKLKKEIYLLEDIFRKV